MASIVGLADRSEAREVVLILDCCHAGAASKPLTPSNVPGISKNGRMLLAGCAASEKGWEEKSNDEAQSTLGIFSSIVLDGLEGAAIYEDEVSAYSLGAYVIKHWSSWAQTPHYRIGGGSQPCVLTKGFTPAAVPVVDSQEAPEEGTAPYKGLNYYKAEDARLFFGRNRLTADLVAYLCDHRLLVVVGASGSGKSSVVRAGMMPALQEGAHLQKSDGRPAGSEFWPVHIITPTAHPLKELAASLTRDSESVTAQTTLMDDMMRESRSLNMYSARLLARLGEGGSRPDRLLLMVDQFEELFTLCQDRVEREAFVDNLLMAASLDGVTTVVITMRADFYAQCADYENLWQILQTNQRNILPMSEEEMRLAIEEPANQYGWEFEEGLVDLLLAEVYNESAALPLLSHALLETWTRRSGRRLTFTGYQASGRVQGAIAKRAESTLDKLSSHQKAIARNIFLSLTEVGEDTPDTRRRSSLQELVPEGEDESEARKVLSLLADARLVTTYQDEVEVAHEALIRAWPTLREWLDEERESLRTERNLRNAATEWERSGRDYGSLYFGKRLEQASEWAIQSGELGERERNFLAASQANEVLTGNWHEVAALVEELKKQNVAQQKAMKRVWIDALSDPERFVSKRARAGDALGLLGDPRPGVGLGPDGLPDIDWVNVKAEPFLMGEGKYQYTYRAITESYRISRYPITVAQYRTFVDAGGYEQRMNWTRAGRQWLKKNNATGPKILTDSFGTLNHPQVNVNWYEAMAFCKWLSNQLSHQMEKMITISLPTEAQWELAARWTDGRLYPWGTSGDPATHCNMNTTGIGTTSAVGIFPMGNAECGAADMAGNVWEWTGSLYKDYPYDVNDGREDPEAGGRRTLRGGSWYSTEWYVRCADRGSFVPDDRGENYGFRVVRHETARED